MPQGAVIPRGARLDLQFKKAVKYDARGRVALIGPAGSGKSYTMLELARTLAGPNGKIAAIDTEHGSLSKYADMFDFDVIELDSYSPENFMAALDAAEAQKYDVFCCDSLSHFWVGKDGALEFVDMANKRQRDQHGGWRDWRPHERAMVDRMIASPCHTLVTMRTKNDYVEEVNAQGKKVRRKIGLAPVQREGLEYEFDLVGYMDEDNTFIVDKTRCPAYSKKAITQPADKDFVPFVTWLKGVNRPAPTPMEAVQAHTLSSGAKNRPGDGATASPLTAPKTWNAAPPAVPAAAAPAPPKEISEAITEMWKRMSTREGYSNVFADLKQNMVELLGQSYGESNFEAILNRYNRKSPEEFISGSNRSYAEARQCARDLYHSVQDILSLQKTEIGTPTDFAFGEEAELSNDVVLAK